MNVEPESDNNTAKENHSNVTKDNDGDLAKESDINVEIQLKKLETIADKLSADSVSQDTDSDSDISKSGTKTGVVKGTLYGTPVINVASSYTKLPSDNKFAKDICDVINFENLPNSTGKYKQISNLLKKVKTEVDRIHDT